ncbi:MAG TPA: protein kinase, partial [Pirellulales bacterium]|nr:protein kinase [Pirellulales bacterium]
MSATSMHVGSLAPDFDLPCTPIAESLADRAKLADYRGRWLMLVFYPRDFSLICPTELTAISARIGEFRRQGCEVLGVSSDSIDSHLRWIAAPKEQGGLGGLDFPLASDADGEVCRSYGVFLEYQHVALRGLFIVDPNGVLQYQAVHNLSVGRRADELLRILAALQTGGLCAESWTPEKPTLDAARGLGPGDSISHYRIERQIGRGAFSSVFRAQDTMLQRTVALKVMKPDSPLAPAAVLAEARAAAALNHPNVCTIYSVDDDDDVPVIAMEYLSGGPLSKQIANRPLPPGETAGIVRQIASGMAAAHARGVVHGDLKPANVFITREGAVKILDFGLARREQPAADPDETTDMAPIGVTGTPSYMAPEQADGRPASAASDVFALGSMLYEMLTGRQAFAGDNVLQVLGRIRDVEPEALAADLPEPFASLLRELLVADPDERTLTMAEVAERLADVEL